MKWLQKYAQKLILMMAFWGQTKKGQKIVAIWIKKPSWEWNFFLIFVSKYEKRCQDFLLYLTTLEKYQAMGKFRSDCLYFC